jgi:hypothetical protein
MNHRRNWFPFSIIALAVLCAPAGNSFGSGLDAEGRLHLSAGGGFSPVVGNLNDTLTDGWNFKIGLDYDVTEKFGVAFEYMNNHLGVAQGILNDYSARLSGSPTEGDSNIWSVTLNPTWRFSLGHRVGAYLIGGGGYYHIKSEVTTPGLAYQPPYCDYYWGCWPGGFVEADYVVAERKDDTGGINVGGGFTFEFAGGTQFFMESRYHYIFSYGPDIQMLPFTAGIRF